MISQNFQVLRQLKHSLKEFQRSFSELIAYFFKSTFQLISRFNPNLSHFGWNQILRDQYQKLDLGAKKEPETHYFSLSITRSCLHQILPKYCAFEPQFPLLESLL